MSDFVLKPMARFEWERIIRRAALPSQVKYLALMAATYGNTDGTSVRPGVERLARVMSVSEPTVKRNLSALRTAGFIERTKQGNRHAKKSDEYRLTVPSDVLERLALDPDEQATSGDR